MATEEEVEVVVGQEPPEEEEEEEEVEQETIKERLAYLLPTWEPKVADKIEENLKQARAENPDESKPYMVALLGIPGSGKTVSAFLIADMLEQKGIHVMITPHDGYHYPLAVLQTFPDPEDAVYRRGAPDTFDPLLLSRDLDRIKNGREPLIMLPGFDHAKGDPEPNKHVFDRSRHDVVLCEGLYLLHDQDGWEEVGPYFDLSIFMHTDIDVCMDRLKVRNQCIPGYTPEEIEVRCEKVDRVNALTVMDSKDRADMVVTAPAYLRPTWEPQVAERILQRVKEARVEDPDVTESKPFMVALVGIPGSGKTVSAFLIASILEKEAKLKTMIAPHDGYHYPLSVLKTFPDPEDAVYRRGAPDTFDPLLLSRDLDRIKNGREPVIMLPAFEHAKGDPEPNKHVFDRSIHNVVLCEGLYLLHDGDGWEEVGPHFDLTIFLESNIDVCMDRLKVRNQCIPGYTPEEIEVRCEEVDRVNALTVMASKVRADILVESAEFAQSQSP